MSVKIRLSRGGTKKRPFYRIVVADARMPRDGRFIEKIGTFDPLKAKDDASRVVLDQEKAKAWLAKGAAADRPRAAPARRPRPRQARGAQQSEEGAAEEEGAGARRRCCGSSRKGRGGSGRLNALNATCARPTA